MCYDDGTNRKPRDMCSLYKVLEGVVSGVLKCLRVECQIAVALTDGCISFSEASLGAMALAACVRKDDGSTIAQAFTIHEGFGNTTVRTIAIV